MSFSIDPTYDHRLAAELFFRDFLQAWDGDVRANWGCIAHPWAFGAYELNVAIEYPVHDGIAVKTHWCVAILDCIDCSEGFSNGIERIFEIFPGRPGGAEVGGAAIDSIVRGEKFQAAPLVNVARFHGRPFFSVA
jgi:hypothetical protein